MIFDDQIVDPIAKAEYQRQRSEFAAVLHDANNLVISAFDMLKTPRTQNGAEVHAAALLLTRHVIEMVDGVGVLVGKGCAEPCKNLLRGALEAALGVLYIIERDSARRNLAYQLGHAHKRIKLYSKYDKNTLQGRAFDAEMKDDEFWQTMKPPPADVQQ